MAEYKLPVEMPAFLGAGSEFIRVENVPTYVNGVIKLDDLLNDTTLIGYIYGGISSSAANIFWVNNGAESSASSQIFKVYLTKTDPLAIHDLNEQSQGSLKLNVYPNPNDGKFVVKYQLTQPTHVRLLLSTMEGKKIEDKWYENQPVGEKTFERRIRGISKGGVYLLTIETSYEKATQKIIIEP